MTSTAEARSSLPWARYLPMAQGNAVVRKHSNMRRDRASSRVCSPSVSYWRNNGGTRKAVRAAIVAAISRRRPAGLIASNQRLTPAPSLKSTIDAPRARRSLTPRLTAAITWGKRDVRASGFSRRSRPIPPAPLTLPLPAKAGRGAATAVRSFAGLCAARAGKRHRCSARAGARAPSPRFCGER